MLLKWRVGQAARRAETKVLPEIWAAWRNSPFVAATIRYLAAFEDWISDPPMTERDRINRYIKETRSWSHKRYLAGR